MSREKNTNRTWIFEEAPIPQAVFTMAIPTIITQLINIVYNFADAWYVGRTGSAAMMAALSVSLPIFIIIQALANLFGIGGASAISRALGRKDTVRARKIFAFSLYGGLAAAIVYGIIVFFSRPLIIPLIGGNADSYSYIYDYMFWTMVVGAIPTLGNALCGHLVRSIGAAKEAGFGMSMGGVLNIILDPIFMFVLLPPGMEVTGAAVATCLSNMCALVYFVIFLYRHRDNPVFTFSPSDVTLAEDIPGEVFSIGTAAALQTFLAMVSNIFANKLVAEYGSAAVAGMGIAKKVNMIAFNTCMGLTQGVLPLIAYNYGAHRYQRMQKTIRFTAGVAVGFASCCTIFFRLFARQLITFFIDEPASVEFGTQFLRIIAFAAPLCALSYMANTIFQAAGKRKYSLALSTMRKGVVDIPAMILFKMLMGLSGVTWATPFAEVTSAVTAAVLYLRFRKQLGEAKSGGNGAVDAVSELQEAAGAAKRSGSGEDSGVSEMIEE